MQENKTSEESLNNSNSSKSQEPQNDQLRSNESDFSTKKLSNTEEDESKKEGTEYKGEGHGHDYSLPIAGEDGSTEEHHSGNKDNKSSKNSDKNQPSEQGKTPGEQSSI